MWDKLPDLIFARWTHAVAFVCASILALTGAYFSSRDSVMIACAVLGLAGGYLACVPIDAYFRRRSAEARRIKAADIAAKKRQAEQDEQARLLANRRASAVETLIHLHGWEIVALKWIYHARSGRVRASKNFTGIDGLYEHHILEVEDPRADKTDTFYKIAPSVMEKLKEAYGEPDAETVERRPPWERDR